MKRVRKPDKLQALARRLARAVAEMREGLLDVPTMEEWEKIKRLAKKYLKLEGK